MEVLFPTIFLVLLGFVLLLNVITLPANWIMLGLIGLWRFAYPSPGDMGVFFFAMLVGLALFGEVIEYIAQGWGSKKYGSSTSGMWAGLLGALVGALAGLPLLFGLGAFIGALVGRVDRLLSHGALQGAQRLRSLSGRQRRAGGPIPRHRGQMRYRCRHAQPHLPRYFSGAGVS